MLEIVIAKPEIEKVSLSNKLYKRDEVIVYEITRHNKDFRILKELGGKFCWIRLKTKSDNCTISINGFRKYEAAIDAALSYGYTVRAFKDENEFWEFLKGGI